MAGGGTTRWGQASGEAVIAAAFQARGLRIAPYATWQRLPDPRGRMVVAGFPFTTIYQTVGKVEFVVARDGLPEVTLEIKHQGVSGSCDEKLPYVLLNAVYEWPSRYGILVLSGSHWSSRRGVAAKAAMRRLAALAAPANRRFDVFDMVEATNYISGSF